MQVALHDKTLYELVSNMDYKVAVLLLIDLLYKLSKQDLDRLGLCKHEELLESI